MNKTLKIKDLKIGGFKQVIEATDPDSQLHCFIAIHDTTLGPALGGIRIYPYSSPDNAIDDVLNLAKAMTYKAAIAESGTGGGKSVIIADPKRDKSERLLFAFADVINSLRGDYIAAEDVGSTPEDLLTLYKKTPYLSALPLAESSGEPSQFTAWGVFRGIQAIAQKLWQTTSLKNRTILIQGLGKVGSHLASLLFWNGADLIFSDVDKKKVDEHKFLYGGHAVSPSECSHTPCEIFAPCALGGAINESNLPKLQCRAIAGSANNQLQDPKLGEQLMKRGIFYAPDFIINSGGLINAASEFDVGGYSPTSSRDKISHIYDILLNVFDKAERENKPTSQIAEELAEFNLRNGIGKRMSPIVFKSSREYASVLKWT